MAMTRITATLLSLFILLVPMPASAQMSPEAREHTEWIAESLREMNTIEVGMTRGELLRIFMTEGGLSTGLMRTYVNRRCHYIKVDVEFEPVGRPAHDAEGRVTLVESDEDLITQLSKPYLAWIVAD
jgi:hypothetical protein